MIFTCFLHRIVLGCIFRATFKSLLVVIVRCFNLFLNPFHCLSVALKDKADRKLKPIFDFFFSLILYIFCIFKQKRWMFLDECVFCGFIGQNYFFETKPR